jgi:uncharacterized protein YbjT (DUF2867 family)
MSSRNTILVTGATGQQGGALARLLLANGHSVRALTRRADSPAATDLQSRGAELALGDFDDRDSLKHAMQGVDAVYLMATPFGSGIDAEIRQGTTAADIAAASGVRHLVYSSVSDADRQTGIPHFDSKYAIEQHIQALGIPHTIIAPAYFMENLDLRGVGAGRLAMPLPASRTLQQTAVADIAGFAALVLERREPFLGKRINFASDELTGREMAEILSRVTGHDVDYVAVPVAVVRTQSEDLALMFEWFDRVGYSADIPALRREYPEVGWHSFEAWARTMASKNIGKP